MKSMPKILAIILARGGSKGLPGKNILPLGGKPLIAYTIEAALKCKLIDKVVVSTDDKEIEALSKVYGAETIKRPAELATDDVPTAPVLLHVIDYLKENQDYSPDILTLLQPTSPLRGSNDVKKAIKLLLKRKCESIISVSEATHSPYLSFKVDDDNCLEPIFKSLSSRRRQDLEKVFRPNGAIYVTSASHFLKNESFFSDKTQAYIMPIEKSIDIDTEMDFEFAEFLMSRQRKMDKIKIGNRYVGENKHCFIIAEAGVNHKGDINLAKKLIDVAKDAGADAVKFQTYRAEDVVIENAQMAGYQQKNLKVGITQLEMLRQSELNYPDFKKLNEYCDKKNIIFLSTPHSEEAANFLESIVPAYKIGSGDLTNIPFLKMVAKKGKPMIIGTGMSTLDEIKDAVDSIKAINNKIILLHCTTSYPCKRNDVNLNAMNTLKKEFNLLVGYSDHTLGTDISIMAVSIGATVIEKHFTLDKKMDGPDHKASLNPEELSEMIKSIREKQYIEVPEEIFGSGIKKPTEMELEIAKVVRKSIVSTKNIPANIKISKEMLTIKRPGTGILPKDLNNVIGKTTRKQIKEDSLIKWSDLKNDEPKIFVVSFNRASDGAISLLLEKMKREGMLTDDHKIADYILAVGDRIETFNFVLKRFQENKKIIHLWAGEISQGTHDEVYRHSMTIMSDIQLCTNPEAKKRVIDLCNAVDKNPNVYVVGNLMLDNLEIDESEVPKESYDLVLYNLPTKLSTKEILKEIEQIKKLLSKKYIWIEPNGDFGSELIKSYVTHSSLPRPKFLGLMNNCDRFITNSSSMYYEAPMLLNDNQIVPIGERNMNRDSKFANMKIKNASDNIIKILKGLK